MNYIKQLETDRESAATKIAQLMLEIVAFQVFLNSEKFQNNDTGDRKDWIATKDVQDRLQAMKSLI